MTQHHVAGVELGGTKCVVVLATTAGDIVDQQVAPTRHPDETMPTIAGILHRWAHDTPFDALGIASFGPLDLDLASPHYGDITTTTKPGWRNTPVLPYLERCCGVPTGFDTDVNGAALAEGRWGAAVGLDDYAYVTVGTGVGVGLIVNGRPTRGLAHCEAGHMHVARMAGDDFSGICIYHGDCVEGLASGPALAARLGVHGEAIPLDHPAWAGFVDAVAQMIQALLYTAGPRRLLLGGGVLAQRPDLITRVDARVRALIGGYLPLPDGQSALVTAPRLGTRAGPLGSIALALDALAAQRTDAAPHVRPDRVNPA